MQIMVDKLRVSLVTSKDMLLEYALPYIEEMVGSVGKMDAELCLAAEPGLYLGELDDGEWVAGVVVTMPSATYGWMSMYYCKEEHRGKGFALKTWQTAQFAVDPKVNLGLNAVPSVAHLYERSGFKRAWGLTHYSFSVSSIFDAYKGLTVEGIFTKPATEIDFMKVKLYAEDVLQITFYQAGLLEKYVTLSTHTAMVAADESGTVLGLAVIRECKKEGYRLAPVLADTGDIARLLILELAKTVQSNQSFIITVLDEINPEAKIIAGEVEGDKIVDLVRMYTGGEQPIRKEKYFGAFSVEFVG